MATLYDGRYRSNCSSRWAELVKRHRPSGERRVASRLGELSGRGVLFLHNRLLGLGRRDGDVDHIALTAGGVHVIDAKRYKNAKVEVRRSGGLFSPVREQLMVNGRDRSSCWIPSRARRRPCARSCALLIMQG